jgi:hypothetical protein
MFLGMIVRASVQFVFVVSFKVLCSRGLAYGVGSCVNSTQDIKVVIVQRVQAVVFFFKFLKQVHWLGSSELISSKW